MEKWVEKERVICVSIDLKGICDIEENTSFKAVVFKLNTTQSCDMQNIKNGEIPQATFFKLKNLEQLMWSY